MLLIAGAFPAGTLATLVSRSFHVLAASFSSEPSIVIQTQPRLSLLMRALHPIRRHYTPSVRVQRHVTGAAPHNGCSAGGSSPARQSIRNGDNAEVLLEYVGNYRGQPQQRSRASHRPLDGHHSYLSTSSTGDRSQGHRTTHGWLQHSWLPSHGGRQPSDSGNERALRAFGCESRQCHITPGG